MLSGKSLQNYYGILTHDFTSGSSQYYGGAATCKEVDESTWAIPAGDPGQDGLIGEADKNCWRNHAGINAYTPSDLNLDGQVNNLDINEYWVHNLNYISQLPE